MDRPLSFEEFQKCIQSGVFPGAMPPVAVAPPNLNAPTVPDGIEIVVEDDEDESNKPRDSYEETLARRPRPISLNNPNFSQNTVPPQPNTLFQQDVLQRNHQNSNMKNLPPPPPNLPFPLPGANFNLNQFNDTNQGSRAQNFTAPHIPKSMKFPGDGNVPAFPPPVPDLKNLPGVSNQTLDTQGRINFDKAPPDVNLHNFSVASELADVKDQLMRIDPFGNVNSNKQSDFSSRGDNSNQRSGPVSNDRTDIGGSHVSRTVGYVPKVSDFPSDIPKYGSGKYETNTKYEHDSRSRYMSRDSDENNSQKFSQGNMDPSKDNWGPRSDVRGRYEQKFAPPNHEKRENDRQNQADNFNRNQNWRNSKSSYERRYDSSSCIDDFRPSRENSSLIKNNFNRDSRKNSGHNRDFANNQENRPRDIREESHRPLSKGRYHDRGSFDNVRSEKQDQFSPNSNLGNRTTGPKDMRSGPQIASREESTSAWAGIDGDDMNRNQNRRDAPRPNCPGEGEKFRGRSINEPPQRDAVFNNRYPREIDNRDRQNPRPTDYLKKSFERENFERNNFNRDGSSGQQSSRNPNFPAPSGGKYARDAGHLEGHQRGARENFQSSRQSWEHYDKKEDPKKLSLKGNVVPGPEFESSNQQFLPPPPSSNSQSTSYANFKHGGDSSSQLKSNKSQETSSSSSTISMPPPPPLPPFAQQATSNIQNLFSPQKRAPALPMSSSSVVSKNEESVPDSSDEKRVHKADVRGQQKIEERTNEIPTAGVEFEVLEEDTTNVSRDTLSLVKEKDISADQRKTKNEDQTLVSSDPVSNTSQDAPSSSGLLKRPPPFAPLEAPPGKISIPDDSKSENLDARSSITFQISNDGKAIMEDEGRSLPTGIKRINTATTAKDFGSQQCGYQRMVEKKAASNEKGLKRVGEDISASSGGHLRNNKESKTETPAAVQNVSPQNDSRMEQRGRMPPARPVGERVPQNQLRPATRSVAPQYCAGNVRMTSPNLSSGPSVPNRVPALRPAIPDMLPRMRGANFNQQVAPGFRAPLQRAPTSGEPIRGQRMPAARPSFNMPGQQNPRLPVTTSVNSIRPLTENSEKYSTGQSVQRTAATSDANLRGSSFQQRIVRPLIQSSSESAEALKTDAPVSNVLSKPVPPHVKLANDGKKSAAQSESVSHSKDESPIEKVPGLDNTKSGIQTSQRDQPNATKQTVTNPIPLSQRLGTLNDLNKNIAPTGNVATPRTSAVRLQGARTPITQRLGPTNPVTSPPGAPTVTLRKDSLDNSVSETKGELESKNVITDQSKVKESAVKVKNEQKEVEVFSGKQNEAVKSPAATNKDKELPKADFSKTSPQKIIFSPRTQNVRPQTSQEPNSSATNFPWGNSRQPVVGGNTARYVAPGIKDLRASNPQAVLSPRTVSRVNEVKKVSQAAVPIQGKTSDKCELTKTIDTSNVIKTPAVADTTSGSAVKNSEPKKDSVTSRPKQEASSSSSSSSSTVIKLKRTEIRRDSSAASNVQSTKPDIDVKSKNTNFGNDKPVAVVAVAGETAEVKQSPKITALKPVIPSLKPIRPVSKPPGAPPFTARANAPQSGTVQNANQASTTTSAGPKAEPVSQKSESGASKGILKTEDASTTDEQKKNTAVPSSEVVSKPAVIKTVGTEQNCKGSASANFVGGTSCVQKTDPRPKKLPAIDSATLQLRINNDVAAVTRASAKAKFKCNDCGIGHTDKDSFLKHLQNSEHFERLKSRLQLSECFEGNKCRLCEQVTSAETCNKLQHLKLHL